MTAHRVTITSVLAVAALVLPIAAACGSSTPAATPTPTPAPVVTDAPPPAAASPGVTIDGTTVTVVGIGRFSSEPFQLPAGSATMTITACASNGVMPFITLADGSGQSAGLIVDPEKVLNNLKGGSYTVSAQANPDCTWKVVIVPAAAVDSAASPAAASPAAASPAASG